MSSDRAAAMRIEWTTGQVFRGTLVVLAVGVGFWLVFVSRQALFSLFAAIVISTAIGPAVRGLEQRGLPRAMGVMAIFAGLAVGAVIVALALAPLAAEQGTRIAAALGEAYAALLANLHSSPSYLVRQLAAQLPPAFDLTRTGEGVPASETVARLWGYVAVVSDGLFVSAAVLLLVFYWTLERDRVVRSALLLLPSARRDGARELLAEFEAYVGGYIRGVAILCALVGALAFVAYTLLGLPNALLLALAAGLFEAVPIAGPILGALPAVAVALVVDPARVWGVLAATAIIQALENAVLAPRVMRHAVGVHPLVSLLALVGLGRLFGVAGALLAIPLAAAIQLLLDRYVLNGRATRAASPPGRNRVSVLRYDARVLAADARKQQREKDGDLTESDDGIEDAIEALATDLDALLARAEQAEPGEAAWEGEGAGRPGSPVVGGQA